MPTIGSGQYPAALHPSIESMLARTDVLGVGGGRSPSTNADRQFIDLFPCQCRKALRGE
ncbi:MAG: hypothetical protein JNM48_07195 [Rhodospirillales bacterium]|nr:hypothetical protein [Rhodospirillales bacterium]